MKKLESLKQSKFALTPKDMLFLKGGAQGKTVTTVTDHTEPGGKDNSTVTTCENDACCPPKG
jgi:hypothetical protein